MLYRKCLRHYGAALLLGLLLAAGVSGCGETELAPEATELPPAEEAEEPQASAEREISWEPVTVTTSGRGEVCFDLRPEHFIRRYNQLYRQDWGEDLLQPLDQWMDYGVGFLSRSGGAEGHQYVSQVDESNYAEPFLSLCVTQDGARVMETVTGLSQKTMTAAPSNSFRPRPFTACGCSSLQWSAPTLTACTRPCSPGEVTRRRMRPRCPTGCSTRMGWPAMLPFRLESATRSTSWR